MKKFNAKFNDYSMNQSPRVDQLVFLYNWSILAHSICSLWLLSLGVVAPKGIQLFFPSISSDFSHWMVPKLVSYNNSQMTPHHKPGIIFEISEKKNYTFSYYFAWNKKMNLPFWLINSTNCSIALELILYVLFTLYCIIPLKISIKSTIQYCWQQESQGYLSLYLSCSLLSWNYCTYYAQMQIIHYILSVI